MKIIPVAELESSHPPFDAICQVLSQSGLVCFPVGGAYRILADGLSEKAVDRLLVSKRRTTRAPSLLLIGDRKMLSLVAAEVCPVRQKLIERFWPGPLTLLVPPHPQLPANLRRSLTGRTGRVGVRQAEHALLCQLLRRFGRPLLCSSANPESRRGASSPAQVRKNFFGKVEIFVDAGDLAPAEVSTVVDVKDGKAVVTRPGAVSAQSLAEVCGAG